MDIDQPRIEELFDQRLEEYQEKISGLSGTDALKYFFVLGILDGFRIGQEDTLQICQEDIIEARKEFNEVDILNKALAFRLKQLLEKVN